MPIIWKRPDKRWTCFLNFLHKTVCYASNLFSMEVSHASDKIVWQSIRRAVDLSPILKKASDTLSELMKLWLWILILMHVECQNGSLFRESAVERCSQVNVLPFSFLSIFFPRHSDLFCLNYKILARSYFSLSFLQTLCQVFLFPVVLSPCIIYLTLDL